MKTHTAHLGVYDTLADWEVGHLIAELRTGRFTGTPWNIVTVAESREPITTMGGLRILPDLLLEDLDPDSSNLLILPGADMWDAGAKCSRRLRHGSWMLVFPLRRSVVPPSGSHERDSSTSETTPARQPAI